MTREEQMIWEAAILKGHWGKKTEPPTNADRIRAMSDKGLAEWIGMILAYHRKAYVATGDCDTECPLYKCCNDQPTDNIEGWLKSPVEANDDSDIL